MNAVITPNKSFFTRSRLSRGISKLDTVELVLTQEKKYEVVEMMTALEAYRNKHIDEEELDNLGDTTLVPVKLVKKEIQKVTYTEHRLVVRESKRKTRVITKHEEIAYAVANHPFAPDFVKVFVDQKLNYYHDHHLANNHPFAVILLTNNGSVNVKSAGTVVSWEHTSARVEDENGDIHTLYFSPEVLKMTVVRDGIMYFPACVDFQ